MTGRVVSDPMIRLEPDGRLVVVAELKIQETVIATVWPGPYLSRRWQVRNSAPSGDATEAGVPR